MPEKLRRVKSDYSQLWRRPSWKPLVWSGAVLVILLMSVAWWKYRGYFGIDLVGRGKTGEITNRNLTAIVCRPEKCFWLNDRGVAFGESGLASGGLALHIEDKTERNLEIGLALMDSRTLAELVFLRQAAAENLGVNLNGAELNDPNMADFEFVADDGWRLKISTTDNAYKTLATLEQSLDEISKTAPVSTLEYIDLRIPNKVYYKFR